MPMYAYRCTQCGHRFEKIQNFSAEPETECPKCHGLLERPLTAPRLHFKGAGWYVNDYAAKSSEPAAESGSGSESASGSGAGKDDVKTPATKTETTTPAAPASSPAPDAAPSSSTPSSTS